MPPVVIDLRSADDSRDVVHLAVQALAEGKIVAFPTETVYVLAASGLIEEAVLRLAQTAEAGQRLPLTLAVKSADDALDYVPDLCGLGHRLARRCWPGPIALVVQDQHPASLLKQLSPAVQQMMVSGGKISLRVPGHRVIQDVLRLLAGPVVMANAGRQADADAVTAQEVLEAFDGVVQLVLDDGRSRFGQPSSIVQVEDQQATLLRTGVVSEQTLKRLASHMILFVCTGNTCRSPMAEALFRKHLADRLKCAPEELEDHGVIVMSAGIAAMMGGRPSAEAVTIMAERGLDLSVHQSQPLTEQLVRHADLILTMTASHRQAILSEWPQAADRVKLLRRDGRDVADPVGGPAELYRECSQQIDTELAAWAQSIEL